MLGGAGFLPSTVGHHMTQDSQEISTGYKDSLSNKKPGRCFFGATVVSVWENSWETGGK